MNVRPEDVPPALAERIAADAVRYFGRPRLQLRQIACELRQFSRVVQLDLYDGDARVDRLFLKIYKDNPNHDMPARIQEEHERTSRVFEALRPYDDIGVVSPFACYPDDLAIATVETRGSTMVDYLPRHAGWFPTAAGLDHLCRLMTGVGRWIQVFQAIETRCDPLTIGEIRDYIDVRLERMAAQYPGAFSEQDRQAVLRHIDKLGSNIDPARVHAVAIHGDLALGNILVSGERIVVLDFGVPRRHGRLLDVARVFLQLELLGVKPYMRTSVVKRLQASLLEGFDPALSPDDPFFRLYVLLHRINNLNTVIGRPGPMPAALYSGLVRRHHRRFLSSELQASPA